MKNRFTKFLNRLECHGPLRSKGFTEEELFILRVEEALNDGEDDSSFRLMVEVLLANYNSAKRSYINERY